MHLGIVHDAGPDQMEKRPRFGIIYTFSHTGNCEANPWVGFKNGDRGIANRSYVRLDVVALDDKQSDNSVKVVVVYGKIINPDDPSNPNFDIIRKGLACYYKWAGEGDQIEIDKLRTQLEALPQV